MLRRRYRLVNDESAPAFPGYLTRVEFEAPDHLIAALVCIRVTDGRLGARCVDGDGKDVPSFAQLGRSLSELWFSDQAGDGETMQSVGEAAMADSVRRGAFVSALRSFRPAPGVLMTRFEEALCQTARGMAGGHEK